MFLLEVEIARDSVEWNSIVDRNPHSVLLHRYEVCVHENVLPLIIKEGNHCFLFPLKIVKLLGSFRLAVSPIYYYACLLPDGEDLDLIPKALDNVTVFLREIGVDHLSTCAPSFYSMQYVSVLNSWFKDHKANIQVVYVYMIRTRNATFDDLWRHRFSKNARYRIRKAKRDGVRIVKIDTVEGIQTWIDDIYQCNLSALKRQGREGAYPDSYKEVFLSELVSTKKILGKYFNIYGAIYREHLIAYMIIREYNRLMQVNKVMSHTKFLRNSPNDALIGHIVREACNRGFELFEYGWDRVGRAEEIPSLYFTLHEFRSKFGFEEFPMFVYRMGLSRAGRIMQHLYSAREYLISRSVYIPESVRGLILRLYGPRHRRFFGFLYT